MPKLKKNTHHLLPKFLKGPKEKWNEKQITVKKHEAYNIKHETIMLSVALVLLFHVSCFMFYEAPC